VQCQLHAFVPGIRRSVDVTAESVYEAAALGVSPTCRWITVQQIHRWCDGVAVSPDETLKKRRQKQLLA
jgi:hypothetical protein